MGLNGYIAAAVAAVLFVMGGIIWFLWNENGSLKTSLATEVANVTRVKEALTEQRVEYVKLHSDFKNQANQLGELDLQIKEMGELYAEKERQLNAWRSHLEAETLRRPEVVRRAARRALNRSLRDAEQATGSPADGGGVTSDPPAAANASSGTAGNRASGDDAGDGEADAAKSGGR